MSNKAEFESNNAAYVAAFKEGGKPMPPARKALVIACMDGARPSTLPPPANPPQHLSALIALPCTTHHHTCCSSTHLNMCCNDKQDHIFA